MRWRPLSVHRLLPQVHLPRPLAAACSVGGSVSKNQVSFQIQEITDVRVAVTTKTLVYHQRGPSFESGHRSNGVLAKRSSTDEEEQELASSSIHLDIDIDISNQMRQRT